MTSDEDPSDVIAGTRVFVLAGGLGTRIRSVLGDAPKALAPIAGRPFLEYLLAQVRQAGFRHVVLLTGHGTDAIEGHFRRGDRVGLDVDYSHEPAPLGTAGAVRLAAERFQTGRYLVLNGDSFLAVSLHRIIAAHRLAVGNEQPPPLATIAVARVNDTSRFGRVEVDPTNHVVRFAEKDGASQPGLINAGVYVMEQALVTSIPLQATISLERDVFPGIVGSGLHAEVVDAPFVDIGVPDAYRALAAAPDVVLSTVS